MAANTDAKGCSRSIPVHIVEDHNEVLPHIYRAIGSKKLPFNNNCLLHFDSHPDMLIARELKADDVFDKTKLFDSLSIENWIVPMLYAGHANKVIWIKPPWAKQIKDQKSCFVVGKEQDSGTIRLTCPENYFLGELLYSSEKDLTDTKLVDFGVHTLHYSTDTVSPPPTRNKVSPPPSPSSNIDNDSKINATDDSCIGDTPSCTTPKQIKLQHDATGDKPSNSPNVNAITEMSPCLGLLSSNPYILDIDLDFFSTQNPFQDQYSSHQMSLLLELYAFHAPQTDLAEDITKCIERRKSQLDMLKGKLQTIKETGTLPDPHIHMDTTLLALVNDLRQHPPKDGAVDLDWLHEIGMTFDDTELPHHISTTEEMEALTEAFGEVMRGLPKPELITIARSSNDDYCPKSQVDYIQDHVVSVLNDLYSELNIYEHYKDQ